MSLFDLKPLSETTIQELGLDPRDLWYVKIGDQVFGPFETLSLRHYAQDNKHDFDGAFATHLGEEKWKFIAHIEEFKAIFASVAADPAEQETWYWILIQGRLSQPHTYEAIEKKLEMGLLSLTDAVSKDEGETWTKFFQIEDFAHKLHSSGELPKCPKESQFQDAKIKVLEKIESKADEISKPENMLGLSTLGQKSTQIVVLKLDEIDLQSLQETEISRSMKWVVPSAAVGMIALVLSGFFFFGDPEDETYLITENDVQVKRSISGSRSGLLDEPQARRPSSVRPFRSQRSNVTRSTYQESSYPTHIETHQEPDERDRDPQHETAFDLEQPTAPQTEESLVQNADQSLDATMNGVQQQLDQPQVEEVSDF